MKILIRSMWGIQVSLTRISECSAYIDLGIADYTGRLQRLVDKQEHNYYAI